MHVDYYVMCIMIGHYVTRTVVDVLELDVLRGADLLCSRREKRVWEPIPKALNGNEMNDGYNY